MRTCPPVADPELADSDSTELDPNFVTTGNEKERTQRKLD